MAEDVAARVRRTLATIDADTLQAASSETVRAPAVAEEAPETRAAAPHLRRIPSTLTAGEEGELVFEEILGEGGMGIVRLATQRGLERQVAVKSVKTDAGSAIAGLLQEAYVTGLVEHPNVIPVHALGCDAEGRPLLVMKRVRGTSWAEILEDPSRAPEGPADLVWHLGVLRAVCDALRFAHRRGVVHRDVKPANVMIGELGEVYLLDWGVAIGVDEREADPRLPARREARGIAGTPAYMAPEMARGDATQIDPRTDVYLLGAVLYELLTGAPPHAVGSAYDAVLHAAEHPTPPLAPDAPPLLAELAQRAMAARKEDRPASVDELKRELDRYLTVRGAVALTDATLARLSELERALAAPDEDRASLGELFAECRFGFREALAQWPENEAARRGLREVGRQLVLHHLRHDEIAAAEAALATLEDPPEDCLRAMEAARARRSALRDRVADLERWARELDPRVGGAGRAATALLLGAFWVSNAVFQHFTVDLADADGARVSNLLSLARTVGVASLAMVLMRRWLFGTEASRRLTSVLIGAVGCMAVVRITGYLDAQPVEVTTRMELVVYALAIVALAMLSAKRIAFLALFYCAGAFVAVYVPEHTFVVLAVVNGCVFAGLALAFWRGARSLESPPG